MCGITGWVNIKQDIRAYEKVIENMTETLKNREPNSKGIYVCENVLLGHRRLAIVDPKGGGQPMIKNINGNKYVIVYNGELYNTEEVRDKLQIKGYKFESYCDTEVLLTSYIE